MTIKALQDLKKKMSNPKEVRKIFDKVSYVPLGLRLHSFQSHLIPAPLTRRPSQYDADKNGQLARGEFAKLVTELGTTMNKQELEAAMWMLDKDKNGYLDWTEFQDWWLGKAEGADDVFSGLEEAADDAYSKASGTGKGSSDSDSDSDSDSSSGDSDSS